MPATTRSAPTLAASSAATSVFTVPSAEKSAEPMMTRLRARIQHLPRALDGVNAAARLARQPLRNLRHQRGVLALPHRRIQVDELHQRKAREFLDPVFKIVERQAQLLALHKLHNAPAQQINRRNQHGSLTGTPACASSSLSERALETPK